MATGVSSSSVERNWFIAQRWQAYDAEARANLLRILAIGAFYLVHLSTYLSSQGRLPQFGFLQLADAGEISKQFHVMVTLLATAWAMLALSILLCLQQRIFPRWLPYFSTACDVLMLTAMICVADGPRSVLVVGYYLILILATLRLSLPLVRFATAACSLAYLFILGCTKWPDSFGFDRLNPHLADLRVPRYQQFIMLLSIALAGVMLGQIVRRVRYLAQGFAKFSAQPRADA
jgi:hypothetical protein